MDIYQQTQHLLLQLEQALQHCGLWSEVAPAADAFASKAPFCIDSMPFEHWLQWVFLPKMRQLVATRMPLPRQSQILPMAEVAFDGRDVAEVTALLARFDQLMSAPTL